MRSESTQFTPATSKTSLQRIGKLCAAITVCFSLLGLAGCGPKRMKVDFIGFERAYAETSTREVLLNLARLKNHETTYFFKLGQISSSYRMQASITGNGNYTIPPVNIGGNATGGGTPGLTLENDPSFTFIPVNDDTSAQLLLKPIPSQTLYNLYQQGWRVDQLFRLMVDRIEVTIPETTTVTTTDPVKGTSTKQVTNCVVTTIRNAPPVGSSSGKGYAKDASSYAAFLRVSAMVYALQRSGYLKMRGKSDFVPVDASSYVPVASKPATGDDTHAAPADSSAPKASDMAAAAAKGQSWRYDDAHKRWVLMQQVQDAEFYLTASPEEISAKDVFLNDATWLALKNSETPNIAFPILEHGFSIDDVPALDPNNDKSCGHKDVTAPTAHLIMRSLLGIMAEAAQEEEAFTTLQTNNPQLPPVSDGAPTISSFNAGVPQIEQLPLLRMKWKSGDSAGPEIAEVSYRGKSYRIADQDPALVPGLSPENAYWNHDMFRLINQLIAQVTVDISKFPLPGILQLHTN